MLTRFIGEHHVSVVGPLEWLDLELQAVRCLAITCVRLALGCPVRLELTQPRSYYLLFKVLTGECSLECDGEQISLRENGILASSPAQSLVRHPGHEQFNRIRQNRRPVRGEE